MRNPSIWLPLALMLVATHVGRAGETIHTGELLPAAEAARTMRVPDGFQVTLFAGEPDVQQPIGFCLDDRGRLWVAEAYNYPQHGTTPGDRIVILEDVDGDGHFDRRKVFFDQLNYVTGIEVGFGGAWVMSPPFFYFIPDRDGRRSTRRPTGSAAGWFRKSRQLAQFGQRFCLGARWLAVRHARSHELVDAWQARRRRLTERVRFDGGVYRYHPVRHVWEPYADGTTNPLGHRLE